MINSHNQAVYAAFFMEGLRDTNQYDEILRKWDNGCIELVSQMTEYAETVGKLVEAAEKHLGEDFGFPGVFEYEVCNPFGKFFGKYVLDTGLTPTNSWATNWLIGAVLDFFKQAEGVDAFDLKMVLEATV